KKELLMIPIFGWYLKKIGSISIKRNKISKENLGFFDDISKQVKLSERPLIIFPQGTRLSAEDRTPFKKGSGRIYEELNIPCQPIAINSGNTWPKHGWKKINTTLTVSILKPIEPGLSKEIFTKELEKTIYTELDTLS
ncbi:lysophospholipid acyltransferase family protein, partial [Candidatus Pelagibacter ubique]|nr:lysophospholipid acyltransferase family protein [Candidatus Pelagibacter ubique]